MLSRLIPKPYHFHRFFSLPSKHSHFPNPHFNPYFTIIPKFFSSTNSSDDNNNNNRNIKEPFSSGALRGFLDSEEKFDSFIAEDSGGLAGLNDEGGEGAGAKAGNKEEEQWWLQEKDLDNEDEDDLFEGVGNKTGDNDGGFGGQFGVRAEDLKPWSLKEKEDEEDKDDVFRFQEDVNQVGEFSVVDSVGFRSETSGEVEKLEKEEKALTDILKG